MIDGNGFRLNVGIILTGSDGRLFWGRRIGQDAWQFPQGGVRSGETAEQAMLRELKEEVGLDPEHIEVLGSTTDWLKYHLPERYIRRHAEPVCVGQKQRWFILQLKENAEKHVDFGCCDKPEFDGYRWVDYWLPLKEVVFFKRAVYKMALAELEPVHQRFVAQLSR